MRGTGFSFSTSIGAVGATRTDFQLSGRWFKIPAPSTSGWPVQTAFEGAYVNTRDKLPLDQQRYGLRIPFDHEGRSSLGVLPTTMESRIEVAMLAVQSLIAPLRRCVVGIKSRCSKLIATACDPYRPERHYMRGPDRKWVAEHGVVVDKRPARERPIC
ncbi:hypothetical protein SAMN05443247_10374 [Bradyrhizobium erythrophlei]|nr:hypothetical protein SAMN05443247_10374 [Bradyrhizobium erythrophlei]